MSDLISRVDAIDALNKEYHGMVSDESMKIYQIKNWLSALPSADAVEVVRCKDCKYRRENCGMGDHRWCDVLKMTTRADDFCSYGKRREDGEA